MTQPEPVMDWPGIVAEVHRRGMTLTELATREGLSPQQMRKVKNITHFACQAALAKFIDQKPEDLWPNRYPKGKPRILDTVKYPPVASQKSAPAADNRDAA